MTACPDPAETLPADVLGPALAHELGPLLAVLRTLLVRLRDPDASPSRAVDVDLAVALTEDVHAVVDLLGRASRPAVAQPLAAVLRLLRRHHPALRLDVRPGADGCRVDGVRLGTVLDNLVRNEVEHAGNAHPHVVVDRRGGRLRVDVRHRGGRPDALLVALASGLPAARGPGTPRPGDRGVGLLLVQHLLHQLDGTLDVRAAPSGTGWTVSVDVAVEVPSAQDGDGTAAEQGRDGGGRRQPQRGAAAQDEQGQERVAVLGERVRQQAGERHGAVQVEPGPGDLQAAAG